MRRYNPEAEAELGAGFGEAEEGVPTGAGAGTFNAATLTNVMIVGIATSPSTNTESDGAGVMIKARTWAGPSTQSARLLREHAGDLGLDAASTIHDREDSADLMNLVRHTRDAAGGDLRLIRKRASSEGILDSSHA